MIALMTAACAICVGILTRATTNYFKKTKAPETEK